MAVVALAISAGQASAEVSVDIAAPSRASGATVARIVAPAQARDRLAAGGRTWGVGTRTVWSRQDHSLLVLDSAEYDGRTWIKLLLPFRPNGTTGWIPRDHADLSRTRYWVTVRTRDRDVTVYRDGKRHRRYWAVVGAPATPTPHVLAALYERNRQPDPGAFLGPWALSLTAVSDVLEDYGGGHGRVAIHGRAGLSYADPLGSARSHGCIRIENRGIRYMAGRLPPGTPVLLKA